jgi:hypothetical protein
LRDHKRRYVIDRDTGEFQRLMADHGVVCSMSRSGNAWDKVAGAEKEHVVDFLDSLIAIPFSVCAAWKLTAARIANQIGAGVPRTALAYQFEGLDWKTEEDDFIRERSVRFGSSPCPCMTERDCGPLS